MASKKIQKSYFNVKIEGTAPIVVEYRVLAEDEDMAFEMIDKRHMISGVQQLGPPHVDLRKINKKRVTIKNIMTGMINWMRNFN